MSFVVDASVVMKWVFREDGSAEALDLLRRGGLVAPDLVFAECANAFWKRTVRGEYFAIEALAAARAIEQADFEIVGMRTLTRPAADLAIRLGHPAYDCFYIALALQRGLKLVTADDRLVRKLGERRDELRSLAISLSDAATTRPGEA